MNLRSLCLTLLSTVMASHVQAHMFPVAPYAVSWNEVSVSKPQFAGTIDPETRALLKLQLLAQNPQDADLSFVFNQLFLALASSHPLAPVLVRDWGKSAGALLLPQVELRLNELKRVEQEVTSLMSAYAQDLGSAEKKYRKGALNIQGLIKAEDSRRVLQTYAWDLAHIRRDIEILEIMQNLLRLKP